MKRFSMVLGLIVALGFLVPIGYDVYLNRTAFSRGEAKAREDISLGNLEFKLNGLPNEHAHQLFRMLKAKGIRYSAMDAGEWRTFKERSGYNSVMIPVILERYGIDVRAILRGESSPESQ